MPLDEHQVRAIQDAVRMVEDTEDGCGEVIIEIKNHHPLHIKPAPSLRLPYKTPAQGQDRRIKPDMDG